MSKFPHKIVQEGTLAPYREALQFENMLTPSCSEGRVLGELSDEVKDDICYVPDFLDISSHSFRTSSRSFPGSGHLGFRRDDDFGLIHTNY